MRTGSALIIASATIQGASATFGWRGLKGFTVPGNTVNTCTPDQANGFDWGDLAEGVVENYKGFNFKGFSVFEDKNKRDLHSRTFGKWLHTDVEKGSYINEISSDKGFSIGSFGLSSDDYDGDLDFEFGGYEGDEGRTCNKKIRVGKKDIDFKNDQCGGAKTVKIQIPKGGLKSKCKLKIKTISFECNTKTKSIPVPTSTLPYGGFPVPPAATTPASDCALPEKCTGLGMLSPECLPKPGCPLPSIDIDLPPLPTLDIDLPPLPTLDIDLPPLPTLDISIPFPTIPSISLPSIDISIPFPTLPSLSLPPLPTLAIPSGGIPDFSIPIPELPEISLPIPSLPAPSAEVPVPTAEAPVPTYDVEVPAPTVPAPELSVEVPAPTVPSYGDAPSPSSMADNVSTPEPSAAVPVPSPEISTPSLPSPEYPETLPKCLNTWLHITECTDSANVECFCPNSGFVEKVQECLESWSIDEADSSKAVEFFVGLCNPFISENPAITSAIPTGITFPPAPSGVPCQTITRTIVKTMVQSDAPSPSSMADNSQPAPTVPAEEVEAPAPSVTGAPEEPVEQPAEEPVTYVTEEVTETLTIPQVTLVVTSSDAEMVYAPEPTAAPEPVSSLADIPSVPTTLETLPIPAPTGNASEAVETFVPGAGANVMPASMLTIAAVAVGALVFQL